MNLRFYASMGVAIAALTVGFILLFDVQQNKENPGIWIQNTQPNCNNSLLEDYDEFYKLNPELSESSKEGLKNNLEIIIKNHYEKQGLTILNLEIELRENYNNFCSGCGCLDWKILSLQIPENQLDLIPEDEVWQIN